MNTASPVPTAAEVLVMRRFLARVVRNTLADIKVTGTPESDQNTDLLLSYARQDLEDGGREESLEILCPVRALEIDSVLSGAIDRTDDGVPDLIRGAEMYADFLAERKPVYP